MMAGDPDGELAALRGERARLEAEAATLRRAADPAALRGRALALGAVVVPLTALAGYVVYRVLFHWFN